MDQMDMRFQLETLIKSKNEAVRRYEELVKSLNQTRLDDDSTNALGLDSGSQRFSAEINLMSLPSSHAPPTQNITSAGRPAPETDTGDKKCEDPDFTKNLTEALAECYGAASGLSQCLHIVHTQWRAVQKYDADDIWKNYRLTNEAMRALEAVQAMPPTANPSQSDAQWQTQQQRDQEQVLSNEQRKEEQQVPKLSPVELLLQAGADPFEGAQVPMAVSHREQKEAAETSEIEGSSTNDNRRHSFGQNDTWPDDWLSTSYGSATNSSFRDFRRRVVPLKKSRRRPLDTDFEPVQNRQTLLRCDYCLKAFKSIESLWLHMAKHTDKMPFVCTVCRHGFVLLQELYRHEVSQSCQKKYVCKGTLASDEIWGCGGEFDGPVEFHRHVRSEEGRLCIRPLWEEQLARERRSLEEEDNIRQQDFQTNETKAEEDIPRTGQAFPIAKRELPTRLTDNHPALSITAYMSSVPSPDENEARDHDAKMGHDSDEREPGQLSGAPRIIRFQSHDIQFSRSPPQAGPDLPPRPPPREIGRSDDKDLRVSSNSSRNDEPLSRKGTPSAKGDMFIGNDSSSRGERIVGSPFPSSDTNSQDPEHQVDALLREWTTVEVC